jgi:hypothetical protein
MTAKPRPAVVDLLRRIEAAGGWDTIVDMMADGKSVRYIAEIYGTDRVHLRRLAREYVDKAKLAEAVADGAEGVVEDAKELLDEATPETAHLRSTQFNAMLKLAGFLHREKFGEAKAQVNVNLSISDLHLQAVKQVNAEQRAPLEGKFQRINATEESDGSHLLR